MKLAFGLVLAVGLGIFCRFFGIPLPGPPAIMGAVMAIAMASGYTATDYLMTRRDAKPSLNAPAFTAPAAPMEQLSVKAEAAVAPEGELIAGNRN